jgi:branched-chain amino acid transport system ATP-binding protein
MLRVENIDVYRGKTHVLRQVSLNVGHGEIIALIGANGAGKTTILKTISGLLHPTKGKILYAPEKTKKPIDITSKKPEQIVASGLCQCPEGRGIFSQLSVKENLLIGAYLRSDNKINDDVKSVYEMFPILEERSKLVAGNLSGGEQMMLAIGRALMGRPALLMLDEPSLGLAPFAVETIFQLIKKINKEGVTILLVEQNAVMALELSHRAYVLETGSVVLQGKSSKLVHDENVRKIYLGE